MRASGGNEDVTSDFFDSGSSGGQQSSSSQNGSGGLVGKWFSGGWDFRGVGDASIDDFLEDDFALSGKTALSISSDSEDD